MATLTGRALVAAMCLGQVGNLLPHVVVPAIMAQHLMPLWDLSAAQAGLMASAYAFGYMLAVPVLTTLTDRIDARRILMAGSASSGIATALFGLVADGLWSATLIWGLAGIAFAGAYMPGLKSLADFPLATRLAASPSIPAASRSASVSRFSCHNSLRTVPAGARRFMSPALGRLSWLARASGSHPANQCLRTDTFSISGRFCAIALRSATSSVTARIASSFTACAPGSSPSGPLSWRKATTAHSWVLSP
jgi:hypothetical protein